MNKNDIAEAVEEILESRRGIEADRHAAHHRWIEERIEAERARREMYREVTKAVAQWSVIGIIAFGLSYLGIGADKVGITPNNIKGN